MSSKIELHNVDCLPFMKQCNDNQFDLAIVDPPYGISINMNMGRKKGQKKRHAQKKWDDNIPSDEYFNELMRISKNQIIWGGNYFKLPSNKHFIIWDKLVPDGMSFSGCEYAWTSFNMANKIIRKNNITNDKIHPTQKPVYLYKYLLEKYTKQGEKIFDSHLGSGSIAIACHDLGYDLTACEIDKEYYDAACKRIDIHKRQLKLF
jgi:site-specific DNA-methyltransferase (adenine-specific)